MPVAAEQRQQGFDVKAWHDHHQFIQRQRDAVCVKELGRQEERQFVVLTLPKAVVRQKLLNRLDQFLRLWRAKPTGNELFLGMA